MPWFLYFAIKQLFPSRKRLPFFTIVSIVGVALGVTVLMVVLTVMNGLREQIEQKLIKSYGSVQVRSRHSINDVNEKLDLISKISGVKSAIPIVQGVIFAQFNEQQRFPLIIGIRSDDLKSESLFKSAYSEKFAKEDSLMISKNLANSLGCKIGDKIDVYSPFMIQKLSQDEIILPKQFEIVSIFETGVSDFDENTILVPLESAQEIYDLGERVHTIRVQTSKNAFAESVALEINRHLPAFEQAYTWMELNKDLLFILKLEKSTMFFVIIFIILVASFSISSSLLLSVVKKTREIGLLIAIGGQPREICYSFCIQGALIGLFGTIFGMIFAYLVITFRDKIIFIFTYLANCQRAFAEYYTLANIPSSYSWTDFILTIIFTVFLTTLASIFPALKASKLQPSEALHSE